MKLKLINYTRDAENVIASAAKLCYSNSNIEDLLNKVNYSDNDIFIKMLKDIGHETPFEMATYTFAAEEVSRVLTHQLVRNRIGCSFNQQSQRYVKLDQFEYVIPKEIDKSSYCRKLYIKHMKDSQIAYDNLINELMSLGRTEKEAIEDARYVLPGGCETKIIFTINARSLFNFFSQRLCNRAQHEIRILAEAMLKEVKIVSPLIFKEISKPCIALGYCPEGQMQCKELKGKVPIKEAKK